MNENEKGKEFYIGTLRNLKEIYENWGTDIMSLYEEIKEYYPNAMGALCEIYYIINPDLYKAKFLVKEVEYIYQALTSLIPNQEKLKFNIITKEQSKAYDEYNICPWESFSEIERINLIMPILLFTEEFILGSVKSENVIFTDDQLTVNGTFVELKILKEKDETYVSILIKDVLLLKYVICNT